MSTDGIARRNKEYLDLHGVIAFNLVSTPQAGKTSLLESCIPTLQRDYRVALVTTDLASESDIQRIRALRVPTLQVVTGSGRHLDALLMQRALADIVSAEIDLLFIESDGTLECPPSLGQHHNVAMLSVTDGDDRPQREPAIFRGADVVLLTKTDLLERTPGFDEARLHDNLRTLGCEAPVLGLSSRSGIGIDVVCDWLRAKEALQSLQVASSTNEAQSPLPLHPRLRYN
jgi:hydrogenase nickel incorporation protein HypB